MLDKIHKRIVGNRVPEKHRWLLDALFPMQEQLDRHIVEKKGLGKMDLFPGKMVALKTEFYEAINEWRGFKHWSEDQCPRAGLLEELVDTLHFVLSGGIEKGVHKARYIPVSDSRSRSLIDQIDSVDEKINLFRRSPSPVSWHVMFHAFMNLCENMGFTAEDLHREYLRKNKVNHDRQENGY